MGSHFAFGVGLWGPVISVQGAGCRVQGVVWWFQGGLAFKAHKLLYHSTLGLIIITKKQRVGG